MSRQNPIACLDPGHYGKYNRCPGNASYYESEIVWKLTMLQKKYLEMLGVKVILTRTDPNKDLELHLRGMKAEGCDIFISNHTNAVGSYMDESIDYPVVYHLTDDTTTNVDELSKQYAEELAPVIASVMGTRQAHKIATRKANSDRNQDGLFNDNYYGVLHGARKVNCPGLIPEHSFHTNTRTVNWLLDDANLDRLARAEAECIASLLYERKVTLEDSDDNETIYRVQVGAYKVKENAEAQLERIKNAGFDAFVTNVDGFYKVQVGAYTIKENAENQLAKVKAAGFDAFIAESEAEVKKEEAPVIPETPIEKPVEKELLEVDGAWGQDTTLKTQKVFGTKEDGIVSHQTEGCREYLGNCRTSSWEFDDTRKGSLIIRTIQTFLADLGYYKGKIDGLCGKLTVTAIQLFLEGLGLYQGAIDGKMGPLTVTGWQQYINSRL